VKRSGRDEPIGVETHMFMETTQGNSLYSYHYFKLAKMPCFSYYFLCFFFYKIGEQEGGTDSAWRRGGSREVGGIVAQGGRRRWPK
jgi:hypothetical protein